MSADAKLLAIEALIRGWESSPVDCGSCSQRKSHARQVRAVLEGRARWAGRGPLDRPSDGGIWPDVCTCEPRSADGLSIIPPTDPTCRVHGCTCFGSGPDRPTDPRCPIHSAV
jgi:hypothetical protein